MARSGCFSALRRPWAQHQRIENGEQEAGDDKDEIPETLPHPVLDMPADLKRHSTQQQAPENEKKREVVAGKGGRHQLGKNGDERAAAQGRRHAARARREFRISVREHRARRLDGKRAA